jgi:hypothetical protein
MASIKRKRAAEKASSAAGHTVQAAGDLGSAAARLASAGGTYAAWRARRASQALVGSPAAKQVRGKARDVGESSRDAAGRWRKRGRRVATVGLIAGVAAIGQQVRSQPVPPDVPEE